MTIEQRKTLTDLQEKIVNEKLSKTDTSWVETEKEMNDLKQAIINESMSIKENNNIVFVTDYYHEMNFMILDDGFVSEKKIDHSSVDKTDRIHKISGIMIIGWLVLMFALMGIFALMDINCAYAVYGCIVFGIINLLVFRFTSW